MYLQTLPRYHDTVTDIGLRIDDFASKLEIDWIVIMLHDNAVHWLI
jgi:hypothetical protein